MGYIGKIKNGTTTWPIGSTLYGTCSTAAGTAAKAVSCSDFDTLITGVSITVKFSSGNTASSPTLNVNSTGAKSIQGINTINYWRSGSTVRFTYDGTNWVINECSNANYAVKADTLDDGTHSYDATEIYNAIGNVESLLSQI